MATHDYDSMDITVIRFASPVLLGINLEPCSSICPGQHIDGRPIVSLTVHSEMFLKVQFQDHMQLVPFAAVSTVVFKDKPAKTKAK